MTTQVGHIVDIKGLAGAFVGVPGRPVPASWALVVGYGVYFR